MLLTKRTVVKTIVLYITIFIFTFAVYRLTSGGQTPYDYFTRLADAFSKGRYYIIDPPGHLTELIPRQAKEYFVVYPPMPAILLILPVVYFGMDFPQEMLSQLLGAGIGLFTFLISLKIQKDYKLAIFSYLLISFGSIVWFLSSVGSSWYLGQVSACFFLTWAVYETLSKKRPFTIGVLLGAAYLSRINTIVSLPYFLYIFSGKDWFKNYFKIGLGLIPFFGFNFFYNFIRFGTIFDKAYFLLPKVLGEENAPWFAKGVANPVYIINNLRVMFWSFPKILKEFPYIQPSWGGLAIWITTPVFIFAVFAKKRNLTNLSAWVSIFLIMIIVTSHGGTGWAQFGYRFAVDFYPFLILLTIKGVNRLNGPKFYHWALMIFGILVNLWGVIWINKFGWIGW